MIAKSLEAGRHHCGLPSKQKHDRRWTPQSDYADYRQTG
jgi:hypothetical protein